MRQRRNRGKIAVLERFDIADELARPRRRDGVGEFAVSGELVLRARQEPQGGEPAQRGEQAVALNHWGRVIWELCDGRRDVGEILRIIAKRYPGEAERQDADVKGALTRLQQLGLIDLATAADPDRPDVKFVVGIEDRTEFHWQTAIFLESLLPKLPPGWEVFVVVCNNHTPLSGELSHILDRYGVTHLTGTNYSATSAFGFSNDGDVSGYGPLNRVEALSAIADRVGDDDLVCLLDTDVFLYEAINLDSIPKSNALAKSWHLEPDLFFSTVAAGNGVNLNKLLESFGCSHGYQGGGVNVFVEGSVVRQEKFIRDCFRFTQVVFLLGRIAGVENIWMSEMPCFGLALAANGAPFDVLDTDELRVSHGFEETIPPGTFYHYYSDPSDGRGRAAFRDSKWYKRAYRNENFLTLDFDEFRAQATTDHERYFFELAAKAKERLYASAAQAH